MTPQGVTLQEKDGLFLFQDKTFVPENQQFLVLKCCHGHPLAEHVGVQKMIKLVHWSLWWPKLRKNHESNVKSCVIYIWSRNDRAKSWGLLRPLLLTRSPWDVISMDFIVELPVSDGN